MFENSVQSQFTLYLFSFSAEKPKGRGRPQRILLGCWPQDHVRRVVRSVVFRLPLDPLPVEDQLAVMTSSTSLVAPPSSSGEDMSPTTTSRLKYASLLKQIMAQRRLEKQLVNDSNGTVTAGAALECNVDDDHCIAASAVV